MKDLERPPGRILAGDRGSDELRRERHPGRHLLCTVGKGTN